MRHSEFWSVMEQVFGASYARSLGGDLVMSALDGRTADQALEAGVPPREVWEAVCDATGQDDATRWLHREDARSARRRRRV
ncbi:DUF3046 domain-containing protein [Serinibacter arcticus]|uniref:DUF3046 domain-containing protein n=1 Tax=Serinibacter arcticus TaxID=1655435 RepID=A0A2U1ZSU8_9MICO|nr:DUF3046 domain-containing protein [Serinibacter arcticus]PWD50057.1 DUF3046 domain-containing protein [Serinibacter arcticus]